MDADTLNRSAASTDSSFRSSSWKAERPPALGACAHGVLTDRQVGHLRHIENLAHQPVGDWSGMGTKMHGQEDFGAYRFQLAFMAFACALAHIHRVPNAPGAFRDTFDRLLQKMLHPDVWMYWRNVSQGGHALNAHLRPVLKEQWDPVQDNNIMYSAYVHIMSLLYNYLFDDDKYAKPGALTFEHVSSFWGDGLKSFEYDQNKLNDHLYWKMVESGYLGIACEPNCVFQICNQPAIIGFRIHDVLTGAERAKEVTDCYQKTWSEFGSVGENGHFNVMVLEDSRKVLPNVLPAAWVDGWTGALMNSWNRDFVRQHYQRQVDDVLVMSAAGAISVKLSPMSGAGGRALDYDVGDFGYVAIWASEMGDQEVVEGLMKHAEVFMGPTWLKGGFYYPRNDAMFDALGNLIRVEPITGNALMAYADLNVPDGMWGLYNKPWDASHFLEPLIVDLSGSVDVRQAYFDAERSKLVFALSKRVDRSTPTWIRINNVFKSGRGTWTLRVGDKAIGRGDNDTITEGDGPGLLRHADLLEVAYKLESLTHFCLEWR